jgi:putative phosphoribosyl transferase
MQLMEFANRDDVIVLALPRGGVPVGFEIARALSAPLDVLTVRKLGVPGHEEYAMGAIASDGVRILNKAAIESLGIRSEEIESVAAREARELERREHQYRSGREALDVLGRIVILVDDGLATGSTMRVAVVAVRRKNPRQTVVAVPVAARSTCEQLKNEADRVVCLHLPIEFYSVGQWYADFGQMSDEEVRELLDAAAENLQQRGVRAR